MRKRILAMAAACLTMAAGCAADPQPLASSAPAAGLTGEPTGTDETEAASEQASSAAAPSTGRKTTGGQPAPAGTTRTAPPSAAATFPAATSPAATEEEPPAPTEATEPTRPLEALKTFVLPDFSGRRASVLVLGNSFIGSSQVGDSLQRLAEENGRTLAVNAVSQGYAEVSTYAGQIDSLGLRDGAYDAVFLCGFYSNQLDALQALCDAVRGTKTRIVIFPAQNESLAQGLYAFTKTEDVGYLGWKSLIDALWDTGGYEKENLAILDAHTHTNPIGGYAGALMLYAYLYRRAPRTTDTTLFLLEQYAKSIPGASLAEKREALRVMETYAAGFVLGDRPYI